MHNNSRKINRKGAVLVQVLMACPFWFRLALSEKCLLVSECTKKMFAKSGESVLSTLLLCCALTSWDSWLTQKCQVLRQIWIIVSFLRVNCIAQAELGHS